MYPGSIIFADVGWSAVTAELSLIRLQQKRPISRDFETLRALADALNVFAQGVYEQDIENPLFSRIEGLLVFVNTVSDLYPGENIRQRAGILAGTLKAYLGNVVENAAQGEMLRTFFRKAHNIAEEITALGLHENPVVAVFAALAESRQVDSVDG